MDRRELLTSLAIPRRRFAPPESGREVLRKRYFPNLTLTSHEGKRLRLYDDLVRDRIVVLNLMYADCQSLCPLVTSNLLAAQEILFKRVKTDVFFYSFTVRPHQDTPEKLAAYAEMHGIKKNWLFLTGKPADLEEIRQRLGWADPIPAKDLKNKAAHSGMARYGNEPLSQWSSIQGSADPEWIAEEITYVVPRNLLRPIVPG